MGSNAIVKSIIALLGLFIVDLNNLFAWNCYNEICGILIGIIFGFFTIFLESRMIRNINRKRLINRNNKVKSDENHLLRNAIVTSKISLSSTKSIKAKGLIHVRRGYNQYADEPDFLNFSLTSVIIVAIAEEFLFRGYMISIAGLTHNKIILFTTVSLTTILFAFSHVSNAWSEFKCKLPLSILTMLGFLITGALISAIITHIILNVYAHFYLKKFKLEKVTYNYLPIGVMR
jgi:hypothetical protein